MVFEELPDRDTRRCGTYSVTFDGDVIVVTGPAGTNTHNITEKGLPTHDVLNEQPQWLQDIAWELFNNYMKDEVNWTGEK